MTRKKTIFTSLIVLLAAASLTLLFFLMQRLLFPRLTVSPRDIRVESVNHPELPRAMVSLAPLTKAELFDKADAIFKGEILAVEHLYLDFNGIPQLRARITVRPETILLGESLILEEGEPSDITILLPIGYSYSADTEIGAHGIFMVNIYDRTSRYEENGITLYLSEVAACGLFDGERFCFMETETGAAMSEDWKNGTLASLSEDVTLEEAEAHIRAYLSEILQ